jgi:primosomal replication protein N
MTTKTAPRQTAPRQTNVLVGLTDKTNLFGARQIANRATIFEVFDNQDAKARTKIEKEIKNSWIWVDVPKDTKTVKGGNLRIGEYNTLALGGENKEVYFSDRAIAAIKEGHPVGLDSDSRGRLRVDTNYNATNYIARVAVVSGILASPKGAASPSSIDLVKSELGELRSTQEAKIARAEKLETEAKQLRQEAAALTEEIKQREEAFAILSPSLRR